MKNNEFLSKLEDHGANMRNSIEAPFDISEKIDGMETSAMTKKTVSLTWLKKTACCVAAVAAAFVFMVNCIPTLAYAASEVPVLGDVVKVVTFGRFEVQQENYEANVVTPKLEGIGNKIEERLNSEFKENADEIIAAFEADIEKLTMNYGEGKFHLGVTADYIVKTDNENILALDFYITSTEASAATTHRFYNIDKKSGTLITLESMFEEGEDYVTPISEYILTEMKKQNENGNGFYAVQEDEPGKFEKIKKNQNFYINDNGNIVICFDEYEVAAGAQGSPEFEIPNAVIETVLK